MSNKGGKEDRGGVLGIESWEVEVLKKQKQSLYYSVFRAKKKKKKKWLRGGKKK